jgi:type III restriction enzyme
LGRGLRVPPEYRSEETVHPQVTVFNHEAWSKEIDDLVHHVAEITRRIKSKVDEDSKYNFSLQYMDISKKVLSQSQTPSEEKISLPKTLGFKSTTDLREQIYKSAKTEERVIKKTKVDLKEHSVQDVVRDVHNNIRLIDTEHGSNFSERANKEYIQSLVEKELKEIGEDKVREANLQRAKSAFNVLYRKFTGQSQIVPRYSELKEMKTREMGSSSMRSDRLESNSPPFGNKAVLFSEKSLQASTDEELDEIEAVKEEVGEERFIKVNDEVYKSPTNITFLSSSNEIEFGKLLVRKENAEKIDAWVKSRDKGFYSMPYIYRPGTHSLQRMFNPDFIIKKDDKIIIVEIKEEGDVSVENRDKLVGAETYVDELNKKMKERGLEKEHEFHFLSKSDFTAFFEKVIRKNKKFRSDLHAELSEMAREELK